MNKEYVRALWRCAVLFVAGVALQFIFGPVKAVDDTVLALLALLNIPFTIPLLLYCLKDKWKFAKSISGPENRIITICYILVLLIIYGLGLHDMHKSWVFALALCYFTILIGIQAISDLKIKGWSAMPLFHWSILLILGAGISGYGLRQEYALTVYEGDTQNSVIDAYGNPLKLPFGVTLLDFQMEEYEGTHMPKEYLSKIQIISDKGSKSADVRVNHPATFKSWKIYQMDYDAEKGNNSEYSVFGVVRDPMWPVTQIGLWGLLLGCIFMFFEKRRKKEVAA